MSGLSNSKRRYVLRAAESGRRVGHRAHTCHWPGCSVQVPPAMWGCKPHWFRLPKAIRDRIWAAYRPGQEQGNAPVSAEYLVVAREAETFARGCGP